MTGCAGCGAPLAPNKAPGRARKWCSDKCRRDATYKRFCTDCGTRLGSSDGNGPRAPVRCVKCSGRHLGELRKVWTPEAVIAAIQEWARRHGEPPRITTWSISRARDIGKPELTQVTYVKGKPGEWPSVMSVVRACGSWNAAIVAAGFEPRPARHVQKAAA